MKTPSKLFTKTLSALIILSALNIRSVCTFLFHAGRIDDIFPASCAAAEIICYILIAYINFYPTLTSRKISTRRNKILEDGIALLQIFLATTVIEIICCIVMLIIGLPAGEDITFTHAFFWLRQFGLAFLIECLLFF